jgi:glycine dehydrogenase subunit 1
MAGYLGYGPDEEKEMLTAIGVSSFEELLRGIPASARMKGLTPIPPGQSEAELRRLFAELSARNYDVERTPSFLGAGLYDHVLPAAIRQITLRSEFYTAYTPYQPEVSQGTLATVFEFQSLMAELTGMDVANASVYDGASAAAEGILLACAATGRKRVLVSAGMHPHAREVMETYADGPDLVLESIPLREGRTDLVALKELLRSETAAVVLQNPNFLGCVEEVAPAVTVVHEAGAKAIVSANLIALGLLESPGACGADLAVAEAQCFGNPHSFGGPLCGVFAAGKDLVRRMPGRLVAEARDSDGHRGFVLTLQTREQHIRREKATSNICTNNNLVALGVTLYFTLLGGDGLREVAGQCLQKAHYLQEKLTAIPGVTRVYSSPFFHEFVLGLPRPAKEVLGKMLLREHILAGLDLGRYDQAWSNHLLVAVTEKRTREEMDRYAAALARNI